MHSQFKFLFLINLLLCSCLVFMHPSQAFAQQTDLSYDFVVGLDMKPEPKTVEKLVCTIPLATADSSGTLVLAVKENAEGATLLSATYQLVKQQGMLYAVGEKDSYVVSNGSVSAGLRLLGGRQEYLDKLIVVTITDKTGKSSVKTILIK